MEANTDLKAIKVLHDELGKAISSYEREVRALNVIKNTKLIYYDLYAEPGEYETDVKNVESSVKETKGTLDLVCELIGLGL